MFFAIFKARAVFPTPGLAAKITNCPAFNPFNKLSKVLKPVLSPSGISFLRPFSISDSNSSVAFLKLTKELLCSELEKFSSKNVSKSWIEFVQVISLLWDKEFNETW
ncbi:hypothetical protein NW069_03985 [Mycoplasmopsis cynos]|nr:hypothetical protein [Mycoplasmopsis cynos]UWV80463.1 hypothetical protein NW069_03985 [Mycoplasmopsis cynos]WAM05957.1 hypothetical protein OM999_01755 [Mycoplasmopsis cynos]